MQPLPLPLVTNYKSLYYKTSGANGSNSQQNSNGASASDISSSYSSESISSLRSKDLIRSGPGGAAMPSSPGDLKPMHISPPPPGPTSSTSSGSTGVVMPHKVCAATSTPGGGINSSSPSPPGPTSTSSLSSIQPNATTEFAVTSSARQIGKLKRFLTTLHHFACDISSEVGDRVHTLIIGLVNSTYLIEEFHQKIQEMTHYPLRPYVIPFLRLHLPILQNEIMHYARLAKMTPAQYLRQHESIILEQNTSTVNVASTEPFEIFQPHDTNNKETNLKRRSSPETRLKKENGFSEPTDRIAGERERERDRCDVPPPPKRHQPLTSPTSSRASPAGLIPSLLHTSSGQSHSANSSHLAHPSRSMFDDSRDSSAVSSLYHHSSNSSRDPLINGRNHHTEHISERFSAADRFEKDYYRPNPSFYAELNRNYSEDINRDMEDEWKNIHTMLNCILGMVEKTKRALAILHHRGVEQSASSAYWNISSGLRSSRHFSLEPTHSANEFHELKKTRSEHILSGIHYPKSVASDVDRLDIRRTRPNQIDAVNEVKRQAVAELQKAVSAAESKASELVTAERVKMERILSEARRQAAEDALTALSHQDDSSENCWNCGRKANETCSGCNLARYCGAFCQHKDWENHHRVCGQHRDAARENGSSSSSIGAMPSTTSTSGSAISMTSLPSTTPSSTLMSEKRSKLGRSPTPPSNSSSRSCVTNGESKEKSLD